MPFKRPGQATWFDRCKSRVRGRRARRPVIEAHGGASPDGLSRFL